MKKIAVFTIAFTLLLGMESCTKDNQNIIPSNQTREFQSPELSSTFDPSNGNNPFDSTGWAHNNLLDDYIQNSLLITQSNDPNDAFDYFNISPTDRSFILDGLESKNQNFNSYSDEIKGYFNASPKVFEFYYLIRDVVLDVNEYSSLAQKVEGIILIENTFDMTSLSADKQEVLLKTSSIARYSLYFWAPEVQGGLGNDEKLDFYGRIDWWEVGQDDIYGALIAAWTTANPFAALGWGAVSSAVGAGRQYF